MMRSAVTQELRTRAYTYRENQAMTGIDIERRINGVAKISDQKNGFLLWLEIYTRTLMTILRTIRSNNPN